ncbi:MAG: cytochrome C oxidase subunit IV family protein [candidate division Zixibacteria bacterium]|nr:cytochrome C oxidase subunit IV family protein [candidate division Zixibacteria bacterium]
MSDTSSKGHHHILPMKIYLGVGGALLFLTLVTVWVAQFNFGTLNLIVAMVIAAIKASLVVLFFMHLLYDNKIYLTVFLLALATLATFIAFTMADTMRRGELDKVSARPINPKADMYNIQQAPPAAHGSGGNSASTKKEVGIGGNPTDSMASAVTNQGKQPVPTDSSDSGGHR